ncbi:MAG: DUF928 domain-containing protein [Prochlorotrichaceae cyanobacterium]
MSLCLVSTMEVASAQMGRFPRPKTAPSGLGHPRSGTTVAGGVRSAGNPDQLFCGQALEKGANLTALIPEADSILHTLNPDPLILVYLPSLPEQSSGTASLTIADEDGDLLGQANLTMPSNGGLVAFALPSELLPLEAENFYQWNLQIACNQRVSLDDPSVSGWISYQAGSLEEETSDLEMEDHLDHIDGLSEAGYWLDAVLETASLLDLADRKTRDTELVPRLEALLEQENLDLLTRYFLD